MYFLTSTPFVFCPKCGVKLSSIWEWRQGREHFAQGKAFRCVCQAHFQLAPQDSIVALARACGDAYGWKKKEEK